MTHSNLHAQTGVLPMRRPARSSTARSNLHAQRALSRYTARRNPSWALPQYDAARRDPARHIPIFPPRRALSRYSARRDPSWALPQCDAALHSPARHIPIFTPSGRFPDTPPGAIQRGTFQSSHPDGRSPDTPPGERRRQWQILPCLKAPLCSKAIAAQRVARSKSTIVYHFPAICARHSASAQETGGIRRARAGADAAVIFYDRARQKPEMG